MFSLDQHRIEGLIKNKFDHISVESMTCYRESVENYVNDVLNSKDGGKNMFVNVCELHEMPFSQTKHISCPVCEIFYNNVKGHYDQCNAFLLNNSIHLIKVKDKHPILVFT